MAGRAQAEAAAARPAASSSAMERAQRAADSPLRAILDAARLRRRIEPELTAAAATAAVEADIRRSAAARAPTAAIAALTGPAPARAAPPARDGASVEAIKTLPAQAMLSRAEGSAAIEGFGLTPLARPAAPLLNALPAPSAGPPRLMHMVEPEVAPRLIEQLLRPEVMVEMTIRADGSVGDIRVVPPVPRPMIQPIIAAVEQWRFAPAPGARTHRVQLVFKPGG